MDATVRGDRRWQRVLVLAAAVGFVETVLFAALAPLLPELEDDLGLSKVGAGVLTSAYAVGAFLGALPSIWVARRVGVKATVIVGLALLAVSSIAFASPDSSIVVFIARFGQGLGSAFAYTGALAWLTTVAPPARRAEAIGMVFAAAFSGALVGPLLGATADSIGTEAVFAGVALVAVALAVVAALGSGPAVDAGSTGSLLVLAREPGVRLGVCSGSSACSRPSASTSSVGGPWASVSSSRSAACSRPSSIRSRDGPPTGAAVWHRSASGCSARPSRRDCSSWTGTPPSMRRLPFARRLATAPSGLPRRRSSSTASSTAV